MKIIFRILVILGVAALIGGAIYAIVTGSVTGATRPFAFEGRERPEGFPGGEELPEGFPSNGGLGYGLGPVRGEFRREAGMPVEVVKSLVIVAIITVIYVQLKKWIDRRKLWKVTE